MSTIPETRDVQGVLERLARAGRPLLRFEEMGFTPLGEGPPPSGEGVRTERVDGGTVLRTALVHEGAVLGSLWFKAASDFPAGHAAIVEAFADLAALALASDWRSRREAERRKRTEALEALLPTLAGALDVRAVFRQVSAVAQAVLSHVFLGLGLLDEEKSLVRVFATSETKPGEDLPEFVIPVSLRDDHDADYLIFRHMELLPGEMRGRSRVHRPGATEAPTIEMDLEPFRYDMIAAKGVRCVLRVPVRLGGAVVGFLMLAGQEPEQYGEEDAALARRIADHVALALSHQRLADEERRRVEAAERADRLAARVARLREELEASGPHRALGRSRQWQDVLAQATKVAATETTVLLTGESGTGKEVVARFIHRGSPRAEGPFVALNCAALPDQLLESELFGHEKGAFTGAAATKPGRLEQAAGGVLFLDEVGEMSPLVQAKLLRVLQEREFQRLGATRAQKADVRVVAATNRDLEAAIGRGEFREDLYYRLHVFEIALPPLRERPEDILTLIDAFLQDLGAAIGRPPAGLSREARERMLAYAWPGNVRELRNAVERAVILCEGGLITSEHLPIALDAAPSPRSKGSSAIPATGLDLEGVEKDLVQKALLQARHNKSRAARLLGLTRAQLYSRLAKYGLDRE
jgi:transcriptional regulator with GAF, ATPase, and Fis domain